MLGLYVGHMITMSRPRLLPRKAWQRCHFLVSFHWPIMQQVAMMNYQDIILDTLQDQHSLLTVFLCFTFPFFPYPCLQFVAVFSIGQEENHARGLGTSKWMRLRTEFAAKITGNRTPHIPCGIYSLLEICVTSLWSEIDLFFNYIQFEASDAVPCTARNLLAMHALEI